MFVLKRCLLLAGLWLVLTSGDPGAWAIGALAAAAGTVVSLRLLPPQEYGPSLLALLTLFPGFLWWSLQGGLDVAWRALHPSVPLKPGWIAYPVRLPPGILRMSLSSELSLMPGTLPAGGDEQFLYVHCLDTDQPVPQLMAAEERRFAAKLGIDREESNV